MSFSEDELLEILNLTAEISELKAVRKCEGAGALRSLSHHIGSFPLGFWMCLCSSPVQVWFLNPPSMLRKAALPLCWYSEEL